MDRTKTAIVDGVDYMNKLLDQRAINWENGVFQKQILLKKNSMIRCLKFSYLVTP